MTTTNITAGTPLPPPTPGNGTPATSEQWSAAMLWWETHLLGELDEVQAAIAAGREQLARLEALRVAIVGKLAVLTEG